MSQYAVVAAFGAIIVFHVLWHVVAVAGVTLLHRPSSRSSSGKSGVAATGASTTRGVNSESLRGGMARTTAPRPFKYGSKT